MNTGPGEEGFELSTNISLYSYYFPFKKGPGPSFKTKIDSKGVLSQVWLKLAW